MIAAVTATVGNVALGLLPEVEFDVDERGVTSADPIFPPIWEIGLQTIAFAVIFFVIWKFGGPPIKRYYAGRTEGIQRDMDDATAAKAAAEAEAERIRTSLGDIEAEREQIKAEAREAAEAMLVEGRARLDQEVAELEERAEAEIATIAGRSGDELRGEIARHASRAIDVVVAETIDETVHQQLIEDFISRVGAASGPSGNGA